MPDINDIIRSEFEVEGTIYGHTTLESLGGGTGRSLMCLSLERNFCIEISDEELKRLQTVNDVHTLVLTKQAMENIKPKPSYASYPSPFFMGGYSGL